jgi:hypothetical protein
MKKTPFIYLILALVIALGACNDSVFYIISVEPPIADPYVDGSPVNFVVFDNKVYTASGRNIYSYNGIRFDKIPLMPGGRIMQLAATNSYLYALCYNESLKSSFLMRASPYGIWEYVIGYGYYRLQSVYAANDKVFIGADSNGLFIILYMTDNDAGFYPLTQGGAEEPEYMLCGLAYDSSNSNYYLCTRGDTIYVANSNDITNIQTKKVPVPGERFTGIINLEINDTIVAISRNGYLYNVNAASDIFMVPDISIGGNRYSTGALAVWHDDDGTPKLLLAGRQDSLDYSVDSGYTYGYMELELDSGGIKTGMYFFEPGIFPVSSVADNERYVSTIGRYPVNHIFQAPAQIDPNMILFASTQKNGVWSYRVRGGIPQWNAEE